jgi:hypothetical protein
MKSFLSLILVLAATFSVSAQKTNDAIQKQIKSLKADKQITLSYDKASNASKIMAVAGNFADTEAKKAGIQAMNFGMAFFYPGQSLAASPESINLTFWVLTKNPAFASGHAWTTSTLNLGDARYAAKPSENMEYLNFQISRNDLQKVAASDGRFKLGSHDFTFTSAQSQLLKDLLTISETR